MDPRLRCADQYSRANAPVSLLTNAAAVKVMRLVEAGVETTVHVAPAVSVCSTVPLPPTAKPSVALTRLTPFSCDCVGANAALCAPAQHTKPFSG